MNWGDGPVVGERGIWSQTPAVLRGVALSAFCFSSPALGADSSGPLFPFLSQALPGR